MARGDPEDRVQVLDRVAVVAGWVEATDDLCPGLNHASSRSRVPGSTTTPLCGNEATSTSIWSRKRSRAASTPSALTSAAPRTSLLSDSSNTTLRNVDALRGRPRRDLPPRAQAQLGPDIRDVGLDGAFADHEPRRNLAVG